MATDRESQEILDLLSKARADQMMWSVPNAQPTQTPEQMTGGFFAAPSVNFAAIQQQQMAQIQAYAMGTPGVMSPTQTMANPTAANYMLQNAFMVNPYMANYLSQSQGSPGMSLAPPTYMTPSEFGIFRRDGREMAPRPMGLRNAFRDIATIQGYRAFAPYEDPIDEMIAARRRMTQRGESLAAGGVSLGLTAASFMVGGPLGLALGFGLSPAVDTLSSSYFQRRAETEKIYQISRQIATGGGATGFRNIGFSLQESNQLMKGLRGEAARSPFFNMSDYMSVLESGTQAGLFAFQGTAGGTEKKLKEIIGQIDVFMKLAGDPDVKSAVERMGSLQSMGFTGTQMLSQVGQVKGLANLIGTSVDQAMRGAGAFGAQMAVQMGGAAGMGMMVGIESQAAMRGMVQRGALTPLELSLRGGEEGATQKLTQALTNTIHSTIGINTASYIRWNEAKGEFEVDPEKQKRAMQMDSKQLIDNTLANVSNMSQHQVETYIRQQRDLAGQVEQGMDFLDRVTLINKRVEGLRKIYGPNVSRETILHNEYGDEGLLVAQATSKEAVVDYIRHQKEVMRTQAATAENKYHLANTIWARAGTTLSSWWNTTVNTLVPFDWIAEREQRAAIEASGGRYTPGFRQDLAGINGSALSRLGYGVNPAPRKGPGGTFAPDYINRLMRDKDFREFSKNYDSDLREDAAFANEFWGKRDLQGNDHSTASRDAAQKAISDLERFGRALNAQPSKDAAAGMSDYAFENFRNKAFSGSGTHTRFNLKAFNALDMSDEEKRAYLNAAMDRSSDFKNAIDQTVKAVKSLDHVSIDSQVESSETLLKSAERMGIGRKQQGVITTLANFLAQNTTGATKQSLSQATYDVLSSIASEKSSNAGIGYIQLLENSGIKLKPGVNADDVVGRVSQARKDLSEAYKTEGKDFTSFPAGNAAYQRGVNNVVEGARGMQAAGAQLLNLEYASAPSAWSSKEDIDKWTKYKADSAFQEYFNALQDEGKVTGSIEDYRKGEGKTKYDSMVRESQQRAGLASQITNANLDTNFQLNSNQNLRRMANSIEEIQGVMLKLDSVLSSPKYRANGA